MADAPPERRSRGGLIRSFACASRGLAIQLATQRNARIHLAATVGVFAGGWFFKISTGEWCAVLLACGIVWAAETMNTAIEVLTDHLHPERHEAVGRAKDLAAGAVLAASIAAAAVGVIVFGLRVWALL